MFPYTYSISHKGYTFHKGMKLTVPRGFIHVMQYICSIVDFLDIRSKSPLISFYMVIVVSDHRVFLLLIIIKHILI